MLTKKQYELLLFINERLKETGVSPSFDEMKEALNLKSKSGIHRLITALEERGFRQREVSMVNASFGLTRGDWDLRIWGRNLTNDQWLITWFPAVAQTGSLTGYPNQPRTYGASLRYSF